MIDTRKTATLVGILKANPHFCRIVAIVVACSIFYHFPFFAGLFGWVSVQQALSGFHEFYALVFFAPVVYAAYVYGVTGATLTSFIIVLLLLPSATTTEPYLQSLFRATAFAIILTAVGAAVALIVKGDEKHRKSLKELRHLYDVGKAAQASSSLYSFLPSAAQLIRDALALPPQTRVTIQTGDTVVEQPPHEQQELETVVSIPLDSPGMLPGLLTVACPPTHRFNHDDLHLLQSLAEQVAIGIANAELHEETKRNMQRLSLLRKMASILASSDDINEVSRSFVAAVREMVHFDQASIHLVDEEHYKMRATAVSLERPFTLVSGQTHGLRGTGTEWVMQNRSAHVENDLSLGACFSSDGYLIARGFRSVLRMPLLSRGIIVGAFNLAHTEPGTYSQKDIDLLEQPLGQLAIALENTALVAHINSNAEELGRTYEALETAEGFVEQSEKRAKALMGTALNLMNDFNNVLSVMITRAGRALPDANDSRFRESLSIVQQTAVDAKNTVHRLEQYAADTLHEELEGLAAPYLVKSNRTRSGDERGPSAAHFDADRVSGWMGCHKPLANHESEAEIRKAVMNILVNAMGPDRVEAPFDQRLAQDAPDEAPTSWPANPVAMVDLKGNLVFANSSFLRLWGYDSESQVLGMSAQAFWHDEDHPSTPGEPFSDSSNWQRDLTAARKDGSTFDVRALGSVVSEVGNPICVRVTFIDITRQKQAQRDIEQSFDRLRSALDETIAVLTTTVEKRYPFVARHQQRVSRLASAIASDMGLPDTEVEQIRIAASLHDIGKVNLPGEILDQPDWLTEIEIAVFKTHPKVGHDIVRMLPFSGPVAQIILQHHELLDGSGYPFGLSGEAILLGARILAVADAVDTTAYHRSYPSTTAIDEALREVSRHRGTRYDPDAVDACVRLFTQKGFTFDHALSPGGNGQSA